MKFLRAGRSVRLWINLDANTPDYKKPISQTIAGDAKTVTTTLVSTPRGVSEIVRPSPGAAVSVLLRQLRLPDVRLASTQARVCVSLAGEIHQSRRTQ